MGRSGTNRVVEANERPLQSSQFRNGMKGLAKWSHEVRFLLAVHLLSCRRLGFFAANLKEAFLKDCARNRLQPKTSSTFSAKTSMLRATPLSP